MSLKRTATVLVSIWLLFCDAIPSPAPVAELPNLKTMPGPEQQGPLKPEGKTSTSEVGKDLKKFGEEVASRIDKVIQRKGFELWGDPWTVQGIPLLLPSSQTGFNLGLHMVASNIRRQDPHKMQVTAQVLASDRSRYKHLLALDYPHLWGGKYRFTGKGAYNRDINFRYLGIGNDTPVSQYDLDNDTELYRNFRTGPSFQFRLLREVARDFYVGPLLGFKWTEIEKPAGSLLARENPVGSSGGQTHYIGLAFLYSTLDFEPYPTEGHFLELYLNRYAKWVGSSFDFWRTTLTWKWYVPLHRKLTFAHRTLVEALSGDVPFYEMGAVGGSDSTIGFGGDRFMRGYESNRFIDHLRFVMGFEMRWDPILFDFANQDIVVGFVPFVDFGRVGPNFGNMFNGRIHASTGFGTRIVWNRRFIVRTDFAIQPEGTAMFLELGNSF